MCNRALDDPLCCQHKPDPDKQIAYLDALIIEYAEKHWVGRSDEGLQSDDPPSLVP